MSLAGTSGALLLAEALEGNYSIEKLHLSDNALMDAGAEALLGVLSHKADSARTIQELYLSQNGIGLAGITHCVT